MEDRVLISSFNHDCINKFKELNSNIKYAYLYCNSKDKDLLHFEKNKDNYSINISLKLATQELVEKYHKNNLKVYAYTVNSINLMKKLDKLGVDGIFTDYPENIKESLDKGLNEKRFI